ncbi:MAG: trans-sulfuration enzyme family protein [Anaerolineae bacterium]
MSKNIFTQTVHAGERAPRPDFTPVATPIYPSVAYAYDRASDLEEIFANQREGYVYRRYSNPTVAAFERALAGLEGGEAAYATASGMGAIHGALLAAGARAGTQVVASQDCYGATYALLDGLLREQGTDTHFVDITDLAAVERALQTFEPAVVICETASNPLLRLADLEAIAEMTHGQDANLIVDSTFATPYLCRPLSLGADFVVHSATKYIGGHDDVLGGVVVTSAENRHRLFEIEKNVGANISPFDAWLALRGLKTLALRMRQHCDNAQRVAEWLQANARVAGVNYPGLADHPQHQLATRLYQERGYGGMLSFEIAGAGQAQVFRFLDALRLVLPATTLGDVYSLALYPVMASHRALPPEARRAIGIGDGLVRLSIGIEDADDIIDDLDQALEQAID